MEAEYVAETHAAQDVVFVLMDTGENSGYKIQINPSSLRYTTARFVVGMENCLKEVGKINSTNSNSQWMDTDRFGWLDYEFKRSIPQTLRPIFKDFVAKTGRGSDHEIDSNIVRFSLFAEKEVVGSRSYSITSEANELKQIKYYETAANRKKKTNSTSYAIYWLRSPREINATQFCTITAAGSASAGNAIYARGIAPFGCI